MPIDGIKQELNEPDANENLYKGLFDTMGVMSGDLMPKKIVVMVFYDPVGSLLKIKG